jgi:hypothetical protein
MDVQYKVNRRIQSRVEIVVDVSKPVDAKNWGYLMHRMMDLVPHDRRQYDDAYFVEVRDDEIIFWYPEEDQVEVVDSHGR